MAIDRWLQQKFGQIGSYAPWLSQRLYAAALGIRERWESIRGFNGRINLLDRELQVRTVMDRVAAATLRDTPLLSVVLPTRDRAGLLPRAIASVMAQTYANWELLVVNDASADDTEAVLAGISDPRVRIFRGTGAGVCAARNLALAEARGVLVAYLDDDNIMNPGWLKAVVWAFEEHPETKVLYGAIIVDDRARLAGWGHGHRPQLYFRDYDHRAVAKTNIADIGCIAHRAGLTEARFDESLREMGDWDLFLRLTRHSRPLTLPALACFYTTDAPNRLSRGPTYYADAAVVRAKNQR